MNCILEAVAGTYLYWRGRVMPPPVEEEIYSAQDSLEDCKKTMLGRERELMDEYARLGDAALKCRNAGEAAAARGKLVERRRVGKRLDKLRNGLHLVESQLDAIKTSELDKEIMLSLKASTTAMKKAGMGLAVQDAEQVIGELDEHIREIQDVTSVLANPIGADEEVDLDEELELLGKVEAVARPARDVAVAPVVQDRMERELVLS